MKFAETAFGRFHYFDNCDIGRRIAGGEFFDEHLRPYMEALGEGDVLVDVGANIGFFTVLAGLRGARVEAFEASQEVAKVLEMNVRENRLENLVTVYGLALYDGEKELGVNPACADRNLNYELSSNSGGLSLVPGKGYKARTLDSFGFGKVNLLKIDTQGADLRVLIGAKDTILRCSPTVCFEYEQAQGETCNASGDSLSDFFGFFLGLHYRVAELLETEYGGDYVAVPV